MVIRRGPPQDSISRSRHIQLYNRRLRLERPPEAGESKRMAISISLAQSCLVPPRDPEFEAQTPLALLLLPHMPIGTRADDDHTRTRPNHFSGGDSDPVELVAEKVDLLFHDGKTAVRSGRGHVVQTTLAWLAVLAWHWFQVRAREAYE